MPAISSVSTIARAAEQLGEDEDWLWDVCTEMGPEDGCLWVYGPGEEQTIAFTPFGLVVVDQDGSAIGSGLKLGAGLRIEPHIPISTVPRLEAD
ncbi:MAG: hypothetical protein RLY86_3688 [Pseudomonadota bacterium]